MDQGGTIGRFAQGARRRRARRHTAAAVWSVVASLCAAAAVLSALSPHGRERIALLFDNDRSTQFAKADPAADMTELYGEIARLRSETRLLAFERQTLATKMAELETAPSPITGSVSTSPEAAERAAPREVYPGMPGRDAAGAEPRDLPGIDGEALASEEPSDDEGMDELAPRAGTAARETTSPTTRTRFALEIGEAGSEDQVRTLWQRLSGDHAGILDGLEPKVAIADTEGEETRLRLRAGPIDNAADAMQACVALAEHQVPCTPVSDRGDPLDLGATD